MTIEQKFKKLDEVSHVLKRPGRYIGNINTISSESYILNNDKFELSTISWCPAFLKIFDEIISNSVDHSKTDSGKHLDTIKVSVHKDTGEISVYDNGGIVVLKHKEYDQYIPEMIFELRAGSNFNDDTEESTRMGTHGEGAALTCIFSKSFHVETSDGKNKFIQVHTDNSRVKTSPTIKKCKDNYTIIKYLPDYEQFNMQGLSDDNYKKLEKRVYDIAGCNPKLKVYFNDKKINIKSFQDYIKLYTNEYIFDHNKSWEVGVSKSDGSFSHVSFVNSTETIVGGTHVNYIADQIILKLREYIEKKHKITIKPSEIKNHLNIFINSSIVNPRFNGQTKEEMISDVKTFGSTFEVSDNFIKHIVQSSIVQSILDWAAAKEQALLMAELKKLNKKSEKADPSRILKFEDCAEKKFRDKCTLFITEGDSAAKPLIGVRNPQNMGVFALKGKPLNVENIPPKKLLENEEIKNLLTIIGLQLGEPVKYKSQLRFGKIVFATDADVDGKHIQGLLINLFSKFWPELMTTHQMIYNFKTPIIKVTTNKEIIDFYDEQSYNDWKKKNSSKKFSVNYYKGLGTSTTKEFKEYINNLNNHLVKYTIDDEDDKNSIKMAFSKDGAKSANDRKDWLDLI